MKTKVRDELWKWMWFGSGMALGFTIFSMAFASVPGMGRVTDDTALYQRLSDIRVQKEKDLDFDSDLARLGASESKYKEKLPVLSKHPRIEAPMRRVTQRKL